MSIVPVRTANGEASVPIAEPAQEVGRRCLAPPLPVEPLTMEDSSMEIVPHPNGNGAPPGPDPALVSQVIGQLVRMHSDPRDSRTVAEVAEKFLIETKDEVNPQTFKLRNRTLSLFAQEFGSARVADCTPLHLKGWLQERKSWASGWTKMRCNNDVQRCFNWASNVRLVRENPFRGYHADGYRRNNRREMYPEEFQAILRATDPAYRRFLVALRLTGARPAELRFLHWRQIDWEKGIAVLEEHKTARKTGKPRVLVFGPAMMKLLTWLFRRRHGSAAFELFQILQASPGRQLPIREVVKRMRGMGFNYRQLYGARRLIGATYARVGGWGEKGRTVYTLPVNPVGSAGEHSDFVFLCSKRRPWTKYALCTKFSRLRKQLGLPMSCTMYGLRHGYITQGVKNNTNLKALACLVGHSTTLMIERIYCHVNNDYAFLRSAAQQAIGQASVPGQKWEEPEQEGSVEPDPPAEPAAPPDTPIGVIGVLLRQIAALEEKVKNAAPPPPPPPKEATLRAHHHVCYQAALWAMAQEPTLAEATDQAVFEWLHPRPEYRGQLPPTAISFCRYLREARRVIEGCTKRQKRRAGFYDMAKGGRP